MTKPKMIDITKYLTDIPPNLDEVYVSPVEIAEIIFVHSKREGDAINLNQTNKESWCLKRTSETIEFLKKHFEIIKEEEK